MNLFDTTAQNIATGSIEMYGQAAAAFGGSASPVPSGGGIDMVEQMVNLTIARTALKANVNVANASQDVFASLLQLNAKYK